MSILNHGTDRVKPSPCPCEDCQADRDARDLAVHLGMADDLDLADEAADRIVFAQIDCLFIRPRDEDAPADLEATWEDIGDADREWWAQLNEEGCAEADLSPWEEALEILGEPAWERACRLAAQIDEEEAEIAGYYRLLEVLGGFSADF